MQVRDLTFEFPLVVIDFEGSGPPGDEQKPQCIPQLVPVRIQALLLVAAKDDRSNILKGFAWGFRHFKASDHSYANGTAATVVSLGNKPHLDHRYLTTLQLTQSSYPSISDATKPVVAKRMVSFDFLTAPIMCGHDQAITAPVRPFQIEDCSFRAMPAPPVAKGPCTATCANQR
jgi:hypothetical protein